MWCFKKHFDCVRAVCVSDERVFTGGEDLKVCALDARTGELVWKYLGHTRRVRAVTVCRDESDDGTAMVFSTSDDETVRVLRAVDGAEAWVSRWAWMVKPLEKAETEKEAEPVEAPDEPAAAAVAVATT